MNTKTTHIPVAQQELERRAQSLARGETIELHGLTISHHCNKPYILRVCTPANSPYYVNSSYFWFTPTLYGRWDSPKVKIETVQKYHLSVLEFLNQTPQIIQERHVKLRNPCIYYFRPKQPKR